MNFFQKNFWFSKSIAAITIVVLVFPSFAYLVYPKKAEAVVPTACFIPLDFNCLKDSILDAAFKVFVNTLLRGLTNSIIAWIQGDDGRNVGFVGNFEQEFRRQVDIRGGEFLNKISGIDMCGDIGAFLQVSLRTSSSYRQEFACTLTDIVDNVEDFFDDFSKGGWPAFIRITHDHQNNPYGAYLITWDAKARAEVARAASLERTLLTNQGLKGVQTPVKTKCEKSDTDKDNQGNLLCQTEHLTKTPGKLVYDMLGESVLSGPRALYVADEINEAIAAITNALIDKLIGSVTDGIFNSELSDQPSTDEKGDALFINSSANLPRGQAGTPYTLTLSARNGVRPYRWRVMSGSLPPGLILEQIGVISGIPLQEGTHSFLVEVRDFVKNTAIKQIIIEINAGSANNTASTTP